MTGLFITFEGGEGCGKSTQIAALKARLEDMGKTVVQTREPGGTALGESVRNLLQYDDAGQGMSPEAELLLFAASRAQHVRELIVPAIAEGQIVLCDRFLDSTTVYQGVARAIDSKKVDTINQFAIGDTKPDLTILIDLPPEIGLARVHARSDGQLDRSTFPPRSGSHASTHAVTESSTAWKMKPSSFSKPSAKATSI